jgi:hypothetical protein
MRFLISLLAITALAGCSETAAPTSADLQLSGSSYESASTSRSNTRAKLLAVYNTQLRAEEEVPHISDSEASGHAQIKIYDDGTIEWMVKVNNKMGEAMFMGHIHEQTSANGTGPIRQWLIPPTAPVPPATSAALPNLTDRHLDFRNSAVNADLATKIMEDPARYYVNIHSRAQPAGAIRGQLQ